MEEKDLEQRLQLLQREIEAAGSLLEKLKLDLFASIDALKIEVEILRRFIQRQHVDFGPVYAELKEEVIQKVDPEWMETERRERKE